ncbi:unnamed protein product [Heterobilharzia americana]|nr:unnamed protein product [Heterobilharzia americana]
MILEIFLASLMETTDYICEQLLARKLNIGVPIMNLKGLFLKYTMNIQFIVNSNLCRQVGEMDMASPLGSIFTDMFLVKLENGPLKDQNVNMELYCQYMDNTFLVLGVQHIQGNACHPMLMNGSLGPPNKNTGSLSLQKAMSNMYSRHDLIPHSIQEMEEINTKVLAQRISAELKRYSIPQAVFAQRVLCRSQGTLSDLLRNPKPWSKLKSGRETFRRMWKWLQEPEFQRMSALRLAESDPRYSSLTVCKRKEPEHIKPSESRQPKKPRLVFTDIQRRTLHAIFKETKRPSKEMQSTIAQQLGLEISTVANFFMNARRRSLDKWQEDTSKASSTANSPPDSPYSRNAQGQQSSNNNNLCCSKDGDIGSCTSYSPQSRHQPGHSVPISTPVSMLKAPNSNFNPENCIDLERITRCNGMVVCSSFAKPVNQQLNSNLVRTVFNNTNNGNNNGLFTTIQRCGNLGNSLNQTGNHVFSSVDSLSIIPSIVYTPQNPVPRQHQQQIGAQNLPNNYSIQLTSQIQHPSHHHAHLHNQHQHHLHSPSHSVNTQSAPMTAFSSSSNQLTYPMDMLHRSENHGQTHLTEILV